MLQQAVFQTTSPVKKSYLADTGLALCPSLPCSISCAQVVAKAAGEASVQHS